MKKIVTILLSIFVFLSITFLVARESQKSKVMIAQKNEKKVVISEKQIDAYYFHSTARCYTCKLMEKYIGEALDESFSEQMRKGDLKFQAINIDHTENKHYIKDYKLFTKSFILSLKKNNKEDKWVNCEKIWDFVRDENIFKRYIKKEVVKYLEM